MSQSNRILALLTLAVTALAPTAYGDDVNDGEVRVPLTTYHELIRAQGNHPDPDRPTPWAFGETKTAVEVEEISGAWVATITAELTVRTYENNPTMVPLLPLGTAVRNAKGRRKHHSARPNQRWPGLARGEKGRVQT